MHVAPLPPDCLPAQVVRHRGVTLVWADPETLRVELAFWSQENLTDAERVAFREAFCHTPDLRVPLEDCRLDGTMATQAIPPSCLPVLPIPMQRSA